MDWIEVWLGVSPDGGDGSLERLIVATLVVAGVALAFLVSRGGRRAIGALAQRRRAGRVAGLQAQHRSSPEGSGG